MSFALSGGMAISDFWISDPRETWNLIQGMTHQHRMDRENFWRALRWQTTVIANFFPRKKGSPPIEETDLLQFRDEVEKLKKLPVGSPEKKKYMDEIDEKWDKHREKKKQLSANA